MLKPQYIVIISSYYKGFIKEKMAFGPFNSVDNVKHWLKEKYQSYKYQIDIYPILPPL